MNRVYLYFRRKGVVNKPYLRGMGKLAIISDIHGNLEALKSVLEMLEWMRVERIHCLGDIVGYGPDPAACIELVRENCDGIIAGNHDWAVCGKTSIFNFNPVAQQAVLWTRERLGDEELEFLISLPLSLTEGESTLLVHASPLNPAEWGYIESVWEASVAFSYFDMPLCFIGHTHVPAVFTWSHEETKEESYPVKIREGKRYIFNVGSVGQPRNGDPRGTFAIWDIERREIELIRVSYRVKETQKKILEKGLPPWLAHRLALGW